MGLRYGPRVISDGLILSLDAEDINSYPGSGNVWYDLSGLGINHSLVNSPTFNGDSFTLNGTNGFLFPGSLTNVSDCTVVLFYKTTDTQELWVTIQSNGSYYLSAAYPGSGYYHSNVGSPINYVDLNVVTDPIASGYKDGKYHMWEAKHVNFTGWTEFAWFTYGGGWQLNGTVAKIMIYNRALTAEESKHNYNIFKTRFQ